MNLTKQKTIGLAALAVLMTGSVCISLMGNVANAVTQSTTSTASEKRLPVLISKGDQEITRRLTTLTNLTSKINAATKLSDSDKTALTNEVSTTASDLTTLKTQLDSETTLAGAKTDVQNIYSEYRVYALVAPKVSLIKVADDQQAVEAKLTTLAQKLQGRITANQQAGKDVTSLQSQLTDMTTNITTAQNISTAVEASVIKLQPTDYNNDHTILSGYRDQLKTAHTDNHTAYSDAKAIVASLKNLK